MYDLGKFIVYIILTLLPSRLEFLKKILTFPLHTSYITISNVSLAMQYLEVLGLLDIQQLK